ncbi:MAG: dihydroorotate dehydrogenase-like protein [Vicinamibacterales bacterium]|nr:dihydroorotate dehydrogenase-like protein [Vicinamibacterales bacterium]
MDLTTKYLGLSLAHPFMPGASPLVDDLDVVLQLEDAGASAIVMHSLFEEQIIRQRYGFASLAQAHGEAHAEALSYFPTPEEFALGPDRYLERLRRIKNRVDLPVIGSLNGTTSEGWLEYARLIEQAGADALELNFYHVATDPLEDGAAVERHLFDIVAVLRESIGIPLAVKLSPFYSSLPNLVTRLAALGASGIVLFNRFYQADINPEELEVEPRLRLSDSSDLLLRLRWLAILAGPFHGSMAVSGGVHEPIDAVKAIMAGADAVQIVSALLRNGPKHLTHIRRGFEQWAEEHDYTSIDQMRDSMSLERCPDPHAFERGNYLRILQSWQPPDPSLVRDAKPRRR